MGRNIFQADNPGAMTRAVAAILHGGAGVEAALQILRASAQ
jgi:DhnA family fructose-bisphosphate aldolase class Ia